MHTRSFLAVRALTLLSGLSLGLFACSSDPNGGSVDGSAKDAPTGDAKGRDSSPRTEGGGSGRLSIVVAGDTTTKPPNDGLAGQTPKKYIIGLQRYDILRSATDPSPVTVFDHGNQPVDVDLLKSQEVGGAQLSALPAGTYTHGRVLLTKAVFTIAATVHAPPAPPLAGDVEITSALSDTTIDGKQWKQGKVAFVFSLWPTPLTGVLPPLPSTAGGSIVQEGGRTWMVFPFPTPLTIAPTDTTDWQATITYEVGGSFRWTDKSTNPAFKIDIFDVAVLPLPPDFEVVGNFGATGYRVVTTQR